MGKTTYIIREFEIVSVGKFFAVIGLIWGFVAGIFIAAGAAGMSMGTGTSALGIAGTVIVLVLTVIFCGIFGFIAGAVLAIIYNLVLGAMGGVEMVLEAKGEITAEEKPGM